MRYFFNDTSNTHNRHPEVPYERQAMVLFFKYSSDIFYIFVNLSFLMICSISHYAGPQRTVL